MSIPFLIGQFVLAFGLARFFYLFDFVLPIPPLGRIAFGVATTGFFTASLLLLLTLVAPGLALGGHASAPFIVGLGVLVALWKRPAPRGPKNPHALRDPVVLASAAAILMVACIIVPRIWFYGGQLTGNSDAMQYLAEARQLLSHRSFFDASGVGGLADGSLRGDPHGLLWPAYNASALVWSGLGGAGLSDEMVPRVAFQLTIISYIAAGVALGSAARLRGLAILVPLLILVVPLIEGGAIDGSRDAFRLTALLLLCTFLVAQWQDGMRHSGGAAATLGVALGSWAMQGHALSIVLVPLIVAPWTLLSASFRLPPTRIALITVAVALGFCLGGLHVAVAYYMTGSLTGDNVDAAQVTAGTVYAHGVELRDAARIGEGANLASRLSTSFARDCGWPSIAALVTLFAMFPLYFVRRVSARDGSDVRSVTIDWRIGAMFAAWFLSQTLLLLGAFDTEHYKLSSWTVLNARYAMQSYMFAALLVAWGIATVPAALTSTSTSKVRRDTWTGIALSLAIIGVAIVTTSILAKRWAYYSTSGYQAVAKQLNALTASLPPTCRILAEDTGINFLAQRPVLQLYSKYMRDLLVERDKEELQHKLDRRDICAVVLYSGLYVDMAGPTAPLLELLAPPNFKMYGVGAWRIYVRTTP
ncbi:MULTISPECIES: hypothetical protein [unclassified Bradyrhizobium]|uniref:hypothetical protein n=1 Tax=unclassified Bradyrhizobium TaxID=2631580 RepID=UPI001BA9A037|nr:MULTISPECIES: hypothetical protein [unclassified Bradyrhizobium]MBR1203943.1 hypothetical protein [Bradyrhizobium sp. AUGA SZCCT0124]MBR1310171.1 hypothetical protein [Bradyrhizobium sp. AUGA SZCCT0051]MBR1340312.1 hypothetical protein [Bradyrhizobium sp. AUGA SZCCT0105]MBR1354919.1 hypothetical protein [Bradyrhizobium sp. AUGA SZCCT0045]